LARQDFFSSRFQYTFGPNEPTLRIASGTSLRVICPDSDNELADNTFLKREQRQQDSGTALFEGNPVAGPIYVEGAVPGDSIAVHIEAIELDRSKGQTLLAAGHGLLPIQLLSRVSETGEHAPVPHRMFYWDIDPEAGIATLTNPFGDDPITVRLDPFIGSIGVCPKWGQSISTLLSGSFGGNLDIPAVRPGATLYLPVFRDGGLLAMGDLHAAQGHGEIIGGGIETSGKVDCTIELIKGRPHTELRLRDSAQLMALGTEGDVNGAVVQAYANLLDWLVKGFGLNRWDGYNLMSMTGTVMLSNFGLAPYTVAAGIPLDALPESRRNEEY